MPNARLLSALITSSRHESSRQSKAGGGGGWRGAEAVAGANSQGLMRESGVMQRHVKDGAQQEHPAVNEAPVSPHFTPLRFPCLFDGGGGVGWWCFLSSTNAM